MTHCNSLLSFHLHQWPGNLSLQVQVWQDISISLIHIHFIRASPIAQLVKNLPIIQETQVRSLGGEDPLEKEWLPTPVFLHGKSQGQRTLAGYSPWDYYRVKRVGQD